MTVIKSVHWDWWTLPPSIDFSFIRPNQDREICISIHITFLAFSLSFRDMRIRKAKSLQQSEPEN